MSFIRKGILVSAGRLLHTVANMLVTVLWARTLGPNGVGQYELFRSTQLIALTIAAMGFGNASIFFINNQKRDASEVVTTLFKFTFMMAMGMTAALAAAFLVMTRYFGVVWVPAALLFAVGSGAMLMSVLLRAVLAAELQARRMVAVEMVQPVVLLGVGGGLAAMGLLNVDTALMAFSLANLVANGMVLVYIRHSLKLSRPFDWHLLWQMIWYGLKLASANILYVLLTQASVLLLRYLNQESFSYVGLYTRALSVTSLITLVPMAVALLLMAKWASMSGEALARQVEFATRLYLAYGLLICGLIMVASEPILLFLYGPQFVGAAGALKLLAISSATISISGVHFQVMGGTGRPMVNTYTLIGAVVVAFASSYLLIPRFGIEGAAIGTLLGNGFCMLTGMVMCRRLYGVRPSRSLLITKDDLKYMWDAVVGGRRRATPTGPPSPPTESAGPIG